jgi:uncharacterized repeat protein (TIGR01451 family)
MTLFLSRSHACLLFALLAAGAALATTSEPLTNTLAVHRIVGSAAAETSEPASTARPGDVLEYVAEFRNTGSSTARGLSATLPLPVGTEFLPGSQHPANARASVDGVSFDALPLKRVVKQADGSLREELVPTREYRYLRWPAADLAAGGALSVSARVTVANGSVASGGVRSGGSASGTEVH